MPTASIYTLGCRLNQADSALIADDLRRAGFALTGWGASVDLAIVNSCIVTAAAAQKTRQAVRRIRRKNPTAFVVLVGCGAELEADKWRNEEALNLVVPNHTKTHLSELLPPSLDSEINPTIVADNSDHTGSDLFTETGCGFYPNRTRANLKIQEGCDFFCSYCIVPYTRGKPRSRKWNDVIREAKELIARGHKEIILTGVNIACYEDHDRKLSELLQELLTLPGDFRLRLSSTEPCPELPRLIAVMRESSRICRFLHIPMQYGENEILQRMNRRYTIEQYNELIYTAASQVPDICLGSDVIVGFPGETTSQFEQCLSTVQTLPLAYLHVFRYSPRPGTPAAQFSNQVHGDIASARHRRLRALADSKTSAFTRELAGKTATVLTESKNERGNWEGWTDNYVRAELTNAFSDLEKNQFVTTTITETQPGRRVRCVPQHRA